jgi:glutamate-1-semialdehyde 2,1-aminomutase
MQERAKLKPAMTCLGKIVGGGLPLAAYGGRREIMEKIAPLGPVYQAGTLSGNPVAVSAALAPIDRLEPALYEKLERLGARLEAGFRDALDKSDLVGTVQRVGSMITLFFAKGPIRSWSDASGCDRERFADFHAGLLARGVYWPPSQFEAAFLSGAHTEADVDATIAAAAGVLSNLAKK